MIKSCYIHIPFCNSICSYCDFCKMYYQKEMVDKYLSALEKEILNNYKYEELDTIYIGGGTPSCLDEEELERLLSILDTFKRSKDCEYTIEGNFESTSLEKLKIYKRHGINRLSFGVESIDFNNLEILGRSVDINIIPSVIKNARELGFSNINVDLMYAIPGEDISVLEKDLDFVLSLDVEHVSTYSLMIEEHTVLGIRKTKNIIEDLDYQMYQVICRKMRDNGYIHYEISNFARDGYYSRHNTCYWNNDYYYGFGLGACSYVHDKRISNTKSFHRYLMGDFVKDIEYLSENDKIEYEIIVNLRKKEGINLIKFQEKYGSMLSYFYNYYELLSDKLLVEDDNYLFIPEDKWYISNEIIVKLLGCEINE